MRKEKSKRKDKQGGGGWTVDMVIGNGCGVVNGGLRRNSDMEVKILGFMRKEEIKREKRAALSSEIGEARQS